MLGRIIFTDLDASHPDSCGANQCHAPYSFACFVCRAPVSFDLARLVNAAESSERKLGRVALAALAEEFYRAEENYRNACRVKSPTRGAPAFASVECANCRTQYFAYARADEVSSDVYAVKVCGIGQASP